MGIFFEIFINIANFQVKFQHEVINYGDIWSQINYTSIQKIASENINYKEHVV